MKPSVVRELTDQELVEKLKIEQETLVKLKMNHTVSQLENPMILRSKRKVVARLMGEIRKRELRK